MSEDSGVAAYVFVHWAFPADDRVDTTAAFTVESNVSFDCVELRRYCIRTLIRVSSYFDVLVVKSFVACFLALLQHSS